MAISAQLKWVTALSLVKSQGKYKNKTQKKQQHLCVISYFPKSSYKARPSCKGA